MPVSPLQKAETELEAEALAALELPTNPKPSADDIRIAYKKMALKTHPDKTPVGGSQKEQEERFRKVNEAYQFLTDPEVRRRAAAQAFRQTQPPKTKPFSEAPKAKSKPFSGTPKAKSKPFSEVPKAKGKPFSEAPKAKSKPFSEAPRAKSRPFSNPFGFYDPYTTFNRFFFGGVPTRNQKPNFFDDDPFVRAFFGFSEAPPSYAKQKNKDPFDTYFNHDPFFDGYFKNNKKQSPKAKTFEADNTAKTDKQASSREVPKEPLFSPHIPKTPNAFTSTSRFFTPTSAPTPQSAPPETLFTLGVKITREHDIIDKSYPYALEQVINELNAIGNNTSRVTSIEIKLSADKINSKEQAKISDALVKILKANPYITEIAFFSKDFLTKKQQDALEVIFNKRKTHVLSNFAQGSILGLVVAAFQRLPVKFIFGVGFGTGLAFSALAWLRTKFINYSVKQYLTTKIIDEIKNRNELESTNAGIDAQTYSGYLWSYLNYKAYLHPIAFAAGMGQQNEEVKERVRERVKRR